MKDLKATMRKRAVEKYGSIENWTNSNEISNTRFYSFLKDEYNPTLNTFNKWLKSLDLELGVKFRPQK